MIKRYVVITKIGNNPDGSAICVKYHVNDLLKYADFLDKKYPTWTWSNVYDKTTGVQLSNFTKYKKPASKYV